MSIYGPAVSGLLQSNTVACHNNLRHYRLLATHLSPLNAADKFQFPLVMIFKSSLLLCSPPLLRFPQSHLLHHSALSFDMAWQPPTLRPASLNQPWCICDDLSFARIIPSNDRASIEAAFLAEQKEEGNLCQWHGKFFHAKNVSSTVAHTVTDSCSASDIEDDSSNFWESHYGLNLEDLSPQAPPLTFRIGSGTSDTSKEDDDVDILTSYPGRGTHRVAPIHCAITFGSGGVCLIKALSSVQPTILFIDNEPLTLTLGETHVLCYRTNRFMVGRLEYNFVYNKLGKDAYVAYTDQRNTLYKTLGISLPDSRVWEFPSSGETRIHGPAIMQVGDGGGVSESVRVGVHARTGQPLAIKSLKIGANQKWNDIIDGVQALLSFQVRIIFWTHVSLHHTDQFG